MGNSHFRSIRVYYVRVKVTKTIDDAVLDHFLEYSKMVLDSKIQVAPFYKGNPSAFVSPKWVIGNYQLRTLVVHSLQQFAII